MIDDNVNSSNNWLQNQYCDNIMQSVCQDRIEGGVQMLRFLRASSRSDISSASESS